MQDRSADGVEFICNFHSFRCCIPAHDTLFTLPFYHLSFRASIKPNLFFCKGFSYTLRAKCLFICPSFPSSPILPIRAIRVSLPPSDFGLRISFGFQISVFGFPLPSIAPNISVNSVNPHGFGRYRIPLVRAASRSAFSVL